MGKPGRPRKKKGLLVKVKRAARRPFPAVQKGVVAGRFLEAQDAGGKFNMAAEGRKVGVSRNAVSMAIKAYKAGLLMPPTQPAAAAAAVKPTATQALIRERRKIVKKTALKRTRAEDDTVRPVCATQKEIREALPAKLRPSSDATIGRDLRAEGIFWLSTARSPCHGTEAKKKRLAYCTATPKQFPAEKFAPLLLVSDESLFNVNNNHSRKEYRTRKMKPTQVKMHKYPDSAMVYTWFGKEYRGIHVHCHDQDDVDDDAVLYKTKAQMVVAEKIVLKHISATKRYTMAELELLPGAAKREWMDLERRFNLNRPSKGVNRFAHCHQCLQKIKDELKGADHLILEDNAKIHTSCYTKLYRAELKLKCVPGHPADSADLNPCEHVFSWLKKNVSFRGAPNKAALVKMIQEEFKKIPQKVMDGWIDTYWTRMEACRKAKGDWVGERECRRAGSH